MTRFDHLPNIKGATTFTKEKMELLRKQLSALESDNIAVVVNGSYARFEASANSDFDYFLLVPTKIDSTRLRRIKEKIRAGVKTTIGKMPADGGAFDAVVRKGEFTATIGGDDDTNQNITRRILLLTEGKSIVGDKGFEAERTELLGRYVRNRISNHQLGLFRTICVDFEYKTSAAGKAWGIRNIKLVFSRKMLYFGGALIVAEMAQRTYKEKIKIAKNLMRLTPIERLHDVCGMSAQRALSSYDYFLGELAKEDVRKHLEQIPEDRGKHSECFKSLKNEGHHFTMHIISALKQTYPESHPIHRSLLM